MTTIRAELILYNGPIHTIDPLHPVAEAVAVAGGRIIAVGLLEEIEATTHANTRRIDLAGRTLIPGFNDAHINMCKVGLMNGIAENSASGVDLEAAISQVIGAIEYASHRLVSRLKHRIDGFAHPTDDHLQRCRHRIGVVVQPGTIGAASSNGKYPLRSMLDTGLIVALGSDAHNLTDANPLAGIKTAAERLNGVGATVAENLSLYTLGSAVVAGEDHLKGSISPGKYADMAILSGDPLRAPLARLTDLQVESVLVNGVVAHSS